MASTYVRTKTKRENQALILEQVTSEEEIQRAIERELEEFTNDFPKERWREHGEDMDAIDRTHGKPLLRGGNGSRYALISDTQRAVDALRSLEEVLGAMPCSFCLGEHHPSGICPADEDVRLYNESQPDPRDMDMDFYYFDSF